MAQNEHATTSDNPDPDPAVTAGLDAGTETRVGDTPPASDSLSGTTGTSRSDGPVSGNRTPMFIALGTLAVVVVMVALLVGASLIPS
ncbi:MAG: hypothetical protein H7323_00390 [Frankiales bacterium]|nr:hypothetical protein [Frankiales bacterium]